MDYHSRLLKLNTANSDFNFHPKCEKIRLTHLAFADDIMLFSRGDTISINLIFNTLMQFGACSSLQLNLAKSDLFAAGIDEDVVLSMKNQTSLSLGQFLV